MAEKHIADGEPSFKAASVAPDVCLVGGSAVPFDSFQDLSHEKDYVSTVKARGEHVLTVGSVIAGTQGNAGSGVVSGTSLGSGDCKITSGADSVKAEGKPVARHLSDVSMNNGNTPGKLYTMASAPNGIIQDNKQPCNNPPKRSEFLDKLEALKKDLEDDIANAKPLDKYAAPYFNNADEYSQKLIDSIRPVQDSLEVTQGAAEVARGALGFGKDFGLGLGKLFVEVIQLNLVTQLETGLEQGISAAILAENIRLGNVCGELIKQQALAAGKEIAKPVTEPWVRGDHIEAVTRGVLEVGAILAPLTKIGKLGKVGEGEVAAKPLPKKSEAAEPPPKKSDGTNIKAKYGEKVAHDKMLKKGYKPVGNTDGIYKPGRQGIDGIYKDPQGNYIITEAKYGSGKLGETADGLQMSDTWLNDRRLIDKVGLEEADAIRQAINNGNVEKWLIQIGEDGSTSMVKLDGAGKPIGNFTPF